MCYSKSMTEKRRPGRPATGHDPTRSLRVGKVWDEAMAIAKIRGDKLNQVVTRALESYVRRHRHELEQATGYGSAPIRSTAEHTEETS